MTKEELDSIRLRLAVAMKCDEWGKRGIPEMRLSPESIGKEVQLWYGDGDLCAQVYGNLGLGIDAYPLADLWASAPKDIAALLAEVDRLSAERSKP